MYLLIHKRTEIYIYICICAHILADQQVHVCPTLYHMITLQCQIFVFHCCMRRFSSSFDRFFSWIFELFFPIQEMKESIKDVNSGVMAAPGAAAAAVMSA